MNYLFAGFLLIATSAFAATMPDDPYFKYQWPLYNNGTFLSPYCPSVKAGADMKTTLAWDIEQGDYSIVVAIIDCGCKINHPEFAGRIWVNKKEIPGNGIDDDNNGYIDDVNGWNFYANNNNLDDINGHGTAMAGIIGANPNNEIGYAGVDWRCKLMILKTGDSLPNWNTVTNSVDYAVANGAKVINLSIGDSIVDNNCKQAILRAVSAGVIVVAAAGNESTGTLNFPARMPEVIAVGSTNPDDTWSRAFPEGSGGSNYGENLDVVAPGNCIRQIDPTSAKEYNSIASGTSSSTAFVTGLASLLLAQDHTRTPAQIARIITRTADDMVGKPDEDTPGWDKYHGWGRINMYRALTADTLSVKPVLTHANKQAPTYVRPVALLDHWSVVVQERRTIDGERAVVRTMDLMGRVTTSHLLQKHFYDMSL